MKSVKRFLAGAVCLMMIGSLAACSTAGLPGRSAGSQSSSEASCTDGGWQVNAGALDINKNDAAKAAFEKAVDSLLGVDYQPIYLLGTQTVAGTNYCILAKTKVVYPGAEASYALVYVYEDLDGNATISSITDLAETVGVVSGEALPGGWEFVQGDLSLTANKDARAAFETAAGKSDGAEYEPIGCLASQVVAGTNYCIACRVRPAAQQDADAEIRLVFIYAALDGSAEVTAETPIDIAAFAQEAPQQ